MCQISDLFVSFVLNQGRKLSCSSSEPVMVLSWCFKCPNECQTSCVFKLARYLPRKKKMLNNAIFCKEMVFSCCLLPELVFRCWVEIHILFYSTHLSKTDTSMTNPHHFVGWNSFIPTAPQKMANLTTPNLRFDEKHQHDEAKTAPDLRRWSKWCTGGQAGGALLGTEGVGNNVHVPKEICSTCTFPFRDAK